MRKRMRGMVRGAGGVMETRGFPRPDPQIPRRARACHAAHEARRAAIFGRSRRDKYASSSKAFAKTPGGYLRAEDCDGSYECEFRGCPLPSRSSSSPSPSLFPSLLSHCYRSRACPIPFISMCARTACGALARYING